MISYQTTTTFTSEKLLLITLYDGDHYNHTYQLQLLNHHHLQIIVGIYNSAFEMENKSF